MKKCILLFAFFTSGAIGYGQKTDYKIVADRSYKMFDADTKNGLKALLKNRTLEEVLKNTTDIARDTLAKYNNLLTNASFSGPYTLREFDIAVRKANINFDSWFKTAALVVADNKQPENKRLAALQIIFGLSRLLNIPLKVTNLANRNEFINHDIFLEWKNRDNENASFTAHQLYDAYKLGVRLAQSRGNKQLTDYFNTQADINRVNWIMFYLDKAFFKPGKDGEISIDEPIDGGPADGVIYEPGEKEPVYGMPAVSASFPNGYNQFYTIMNEHLQYPAEEWARGIEGEVYVNFVVEKDGSISHLKISQLTPDIDSAVINAARYLPKLIPAHLKAGPAPVRTFKVYSITFIIQPGKSREDAFKPPFTNTKNKDIIKPKTPGRKIDLFHYINHNSTYHGPPYGRVTLSYTVQVSGEVTNITVLRHLSPAADSEAVRLLRQASVWKPGPMVKPRKVAMADSESVFFNKPVR